MDILFPERKELDDIGRVVIKTLDSKVLEKFSRDDQKQFLDREDLPLSTKFGYLKHLLMKNNVEIMVRVEKFLINTLQEDTLSTYQKFRLADDFACMPNGMMLYKTVEWVYHTVIELHWILFKMNIDIEYKIQALNFLLRSNIQMHRKNEAVQELQTIAVNGENTMPTNKLANIIDLLMHSGADEQVVQRLMATLRARETAEEERRHRQIRLMPMPGRDDFFRPPANVYNDSQNVHDSDINNSIKRFLDILAKDVHKDTYNYRILEKNPVELIDEIEVRLRQLPIFCRDISDSLNRISTDFAKFSNNNQFRLRDILQRVWNRIMNCMEGEMQKEAIKRLAEELKEMSGTCSTGHMSRIVNTLSGFDPDLVISISWATQINANITARINNELRKPENEDLVNAMIETDAKMREPYIIFVKNLRPIIYAELLKEYTNLGEKEFTKIFDEKYKNFEV